MNEYRASMKHSSETLKRFTTLQYDTFEPGRKLLLFVLAVVLIIIGSVSGSTPVLVFCLFAGCVLLTNLNAKATSVADQVEKAMNGKFPEIHYAFGETGFTDGPDRPTVSYDRLIRLSADAEYLYLFVSKASGYMIDARTVDGVNGSEGLKQFIAERSHLAWKRPITLANLTLKDLLLTGKRKIKR